MRYSGEGEKRRTRKDIPAKDNLGVQQERLGMAVKAVGSTLVEIVTGSYSVEDAPDIGGKFLFHLAQIYGHNENIARLKGNVKEEQASLIQAAFTNAALEPATQAPANYIPVKWLLGIYAHAYTRNVAPIVPSLLDQILSEDVGLRLLDIVSLIPDEGEPITLPIPAWQNPTYNPKFASNSMIPNS